LVFTESGNEMVTVIRNNRVHLTSLAVLVLALAFAGPAASNAYSDPGQISLTEKIVQSQDDLTLALDQLLSNQFTGGAPFWEMPRQHGFDKTINGYRLIAPAQFTGGRNWFQLRSLGDAAKSYLLPVDLFWEDSVWVATGSLDRDRCLSRSDMELQVCRHTFLPESVQFSSAPVGMCTKRLITGGAVLSHDNLAPPPVVKRGNIVRLMYKSEGLLVSTRAEVLENGGQGDAIRVRPLDAHKPCKALVMNPTEVEVIIP
jgi:flagella basal body P-ring formation protein FlgA